VPSWTGHLLPRGLVLPANGGRPGLSALLEPAGELCAAAMKQSRRRAADRRQTSNLRTLDQPPILRVQGRRHLGVLQGRSNSHKSIVMTGPAKVSNPTQRSGVRSPPNGRPRVKTCARP
jgi:hypothetical protein